MDGDDIIPPSPPIKVGKSRRRSRNNPKKQHTISSLRSRNLAQSNGSTGKTHSPLPLNGKTSSTSSDETFSEETLCTEQRYPNLYEGLYDADEAKHTKSLLKNVDILAHARLVESGNRFDAQSEPRKLHQVFSQRSGLVPLKDLLHTLDDEDPYESPVPSPLQSPSPQLADHDLSFEYIQFSEWPPAAEHEKLSTIVSNTADEPVISTSQVVKNTQISCPRPVPEQTVSVFQSILDDFSDEIDEAQSDCARSPPLVLMRRRNRKTYQRTSVMDIERLLTDANTGTNYAFNEDTVDGSQCSPSDDIDLDLDLNASRRIVENLNQLSSFFTQPQSFELDFNADLSHNCEFEFKEFSQHSDDFNIQDDSDVKETGEPQKPQKLDSPSIQLLNQDDDIFLNCNTPKLEVRSRARRQSTAGESTPVSSTKIRPEMSSTPSTSKQADLCEQRIPKRLRFDATENTNPVGQSAKVAMGFTTARQAPIHITKANYKRTAGIFDNIDDEIAPMLSSVAKRPKHSDQNKCNPVTATTFKPVGFQTASNKSTRFDKTAMGAARNIFDGECFSDLGIPAQTGFKSSAVPSSMPSTTHFPGPSTSNLPVPSTSPLKNGFAKASGASVMVSKGNLDKYAQTLKDIDRELEKDKVDVYTNETVCKTPLSKTNQRPNAFTTSTPIPNSAASVSICLAITPINKKNLDEQDDFNKWIDGLDGSTLNEVLSTSTQQFTNETSHTANTSDVTMLNETVVDLDTLQVPEDIKCKRRKALIVQHSECFKKPDPIRPLIGSLQMQKIFSSKKLNELLPPKKYNRHELQQMGVKANVIDLNVENALRLKFDMWEYYPMEVCRMNVNGFEMQDDMTLIMDDNCRVGTKELTSAFLHCPTVDPKLVPDHWINNSLKWIFIKLAAYDRSLSHQMLSNCLTPENVLLHLKYRYDMEIDKVKRSAIRKIVEQDDTPAKRMVLFISRIVKSGMTYSLELCDGWYSIRTTGLDGILQNAIITKRIGVGTKLMIQGAELVGIAEACSPLEMPTSAALKISANSTRRVKWFSKLGYCQESWPFAISLNSVNALGGLITRVRAFVLRVYPTVFIVKEKNANGEKSVFRSNKVHERQGKKDDKKRFDIFEKCYSEASEQIEKEYEAERSKYKPSKLKLCDIDSGEDLWNMMENSNDSISVEMDLSATQRKLLEDYQTKFNDTKQQKIEEIVREKLADFEVPKSSSLQKVRLIDATAPNVTKTAILSIWNIDDSSTPVRENRFLDIRYVQANGMRGKDMQLTVNNYTIIREVQGNVSHSDFMRKLTSLSDIDSQFKPHFNEFDTIGFVLKVEDVVPNSFQSVFIVDEHKNVLCIQFWGSIQEYAYEDIVNERKFIVIAHLDWRPQNRFCRNNIPQAFVTATTTFSESPRLAERADALADLRNRFSQLDLCKYIEECKEKLDGNMQPNREANKENSIVNESTKQHDSSVNQSVASRMAPAAIASPHVGVQQRIDRLRNYASPPAFRSTYLKSLKTPNRMRTHLRNPSRAQPPPEYGPM